MNPIQKAEIWRVLHRLEAEDAEDRRTLNKPREERMLTLHPDTSRLVHIMIQSAGCNNWWKLAEHTAIPPSGWHMLRVSPVDD